MQMCADAKPVVGAHEVRGRVAGRRTSPLLEAAPFAIVASVAVLLACSVIRLAA